MIGFRRNTGALEAEAIATMKALQKLFDRLELLATSLAMREPRSQQGGVADIIKGIAGALQTTPAEPPKLQ